MTKKTPTEDILKVLINGKLAWECHNPNIQTVKTEFKKGTRWDD